MTTPRPIPTTLIIGTSAESEWLALPGGELEAPKPRLLCLRCRERLRQAAARGAWPTAEERPKTLCFGCYRAQVERDRKIRAAANVEAASEARFQCTLPFEPVNRARLNQLRAARRHARQAEQQGAGVYIDKRRRAQIAARHALQRLAEGLHAHAITTPEHRPTSLAALHAAELQLPEAWLPFVGSAPVRY